MKCNKCGKEITLNDGVVYCPYCGVNLNGEESRKKWATKKLEVGYSIRTAILLIVLCEVLVLLVMVYRVSFGEWLGLEIPELSGWMFLCIIGGIALYLTLPYEVYKHAKKQKRRAVMWTTAFIVFTPILAGLAYLLTWPKE